MASQIPSSTASQAQGRLAGFSGRVTGAAGTVSSSIAAASSKAAGAIQRPFKARARGPNELAEN